MGSDRVGGDLLGRHTTVKPPPPTELRFKRRISVWRSLREVWRARDLILTLAERDLRARYKQAFLGMAWAVILPVLLMVAFTLFVKRVSQVDSGGIPYPLFAYVGLVPWTFFSSSLNQGGQSLLTHSSLLNKVHCPREVFPVASLMVAGVDALVASSVLAALFVWYQVVPGITALWAPVLFAIQLIFTAGMALIISALTVYVRDVRAAMTILLQLALFATPVAYPVPLGPTLERIYALLNPLAPLIDGYRRTLILGISPEADLIGIAAGSSVAVFLGGYWLFKRLETGFADVA